LIAILKEIKEIKPIKGVHIIPIQDVRYTKSGYIS